MARSDSQALTERVERLREILARDPEDATSWFGLGRALLDLGRADEAVEPLRLSASLEPEFTAAHRDLGRALLESGAARAAAEVLEGALEIAQRTGDLQTGREMEVFLVRARRALGEAAPARSEAPRADTAAPAAVDEAARTEARTLYKRGFQHFVESRYDEAIALYREALELDPHLAIAWNGLSMAHRSCGALDEAIRAGARLVELEPDDPLSHTNLSILYMQKGMIPEAEEERAAAMQLQMRAQRQR
jgi:tetratricopeptide (TPR) repeat protein